MLDASTSTVIVAVVAFISNAACTLFSNWNTRKMKKMDYQNENEIRRETIVRQIFADYIRLASAGERNLEYTTAFLQALLYAPEPVREEMLRLDSIMGMDEQIAKEKKILSITLKISQQISVQ